MGPITAFFETVAIRIRWFGILLTIVAVGLLIALFVYLQSATMNHLFIGALIMLWAAGLAIVYYLYLPRRVEIEGMPSQSLSPMRRAHIIMRLYVDLFLVLWFVALIVVSFGALWMFATAP